MKETLRVGLGLLIAFLTIGCDDAPSPGTPLGPVQESPSRAGAVANILERQALFGDLHIHTRWSFDAYS